MPKSDGAPTKEEYEEMLQKFKIMADKAWSQKRGNYRRAKYEAMKLWLEKKDAVWS